MELSTHPKSATSTDATGVALLHDRPAGSRSALWIFLCCLAIIAILKVGQWREPPFWDAAFSVFPAAITLNETNFDYPALLSAPTYLEGGPNVHANSSVTWLTAIVLKVTPNPAAAFLVLHWIHYAIAALTVTLLYVWSLPLLGRSGAILVALATLVFPLFLTQAGHMYLEMPSACAALLALNRFQAGRVIQSSFWAAVAVSIKEPGIVVAGALGAAALLQPFPMKRRLWRVAAVSVPSLLVAAGQTLLHAKTGVEPRYAFMEYATRAWNSFVIVQDLLVLVLASAVVAIAHVPSVVRTLTSGGQATDGQDIASERRALSHLMLLVFTAFYLVVPFLGTVYLLPRYVVPVLPLMVLGAADMANRLLGKRATMVVLSAAIAVSLVNHRGRLYPSLSRNGAIAERSNEYVDLMATHIDAVRAAQYLPASTPVLYGLFDHYFVSYPAMGYVDRPLANGHFIYHPDSRYQGASLDQFPRHFYLINGLAGTNWIKEAAEADARYEVTTRTFTHGHYKSQLVEIRLHESPESPN